MLFAPVLLLAGGLAAGSPVPTFQGAASQSPSSATHTYNSVALGAEDGTRKIIVDVGWSAGSDTTISSLTVNGVSATQVLAADAATGACGSALWIADVPTGTSVTVVITFNASTTRSAIGIHRVVGLNSSTPTDTDSSTAANGSGVISTSVDIPANGFAISVASSIDGSSGQAWSWNAEATEDADTNIGNQSVHGVASRIVTSAETARTFTATLNFSGSRSSMVTAAWGN